jgi:hypothetical protein
MRGQGVEAWSWWAMVQVAGGSLGGVDVGPNCSARAKGTWVVVVGG